MACSACTPAPSPNQTLPDGTLDTGRLISLHGTLHRDSAQTACSAEYDATGRLSDGTCPVAAACWDLELTAVYDTCDAAPSWDRFAYWTEPQPEGAVETDADWSDLFLIAAEGETIAFRFDGWRAVLDLEQR